MAEYMVQGLVEVPQSEVGLLLESGYLYMELGKWREAQQVFTGVAALIPHSEVPQLALGNMFFSQGKLPQALKAQRVALKLNPDSALTQAHIGETLLFMKKTADGMDALNKALAMEPDGLAADFAKSLIDAHDLGCFDKVD